MSLSCCIHSLCIKNGYALCYFSDDVNLPTRRKPGRPPNKVLGKPSDAVKTRPVSDALVEPSAQRFAVVIGKFSSWRVVR